MENLEELISKIGVQIAKYNDEIKQSDNPFTNTRLSSKISGLYEATFLAQDMLIELIKKNQQN